MESNKFLIVESKTLPEVFLKVLYAKKLLAQGKAKNASEAARVAGVSRSAFYKYKDSVYAYDREMAIHTITMSIILEDEPGVLSNLLTEIYKFHANIITVNQNIPVDGVAAVSISAKVNTEHFDEETFLSSVALVPGVVEIKNISGR